MNLELLNSGSPNSIKPYQEKIKKLKFVGGKYIQFKITNFDVLGTLENILSRKLPSGLRSTIKPARYLLVEILDDNDSSKIKENQYFYISRNFLRQLMEFKGLNLDLDTLYLNTEFIREFLKANAEGLIISGICNFTSDIPEIKYTFE